MNYSEAVGLATSAHKGQTRRNGTPYISHPLRVAEALAPFGEDVQVVGVLHDVIEDTEVTFSDLVRTSLSVDQLNALAALARSKGEGYEGYVRRIIAAGPLACLVKLADVADNLYGPDADPTPKAQARYLATLAVIAQAHLGADGRGGFPDGREVGGKPFTADTLRSFILGHPGVRP